MRRAMFAFVGVAALAALIFIVFQSWTVLTRIGPPSTGELVVSSGDDELQNIASEHAVEPGIEAPVAAASPARPAEPETDKPGTGGPETWASPVDYSELVPPGWRRSAEGGYWYYEYATVLRAEAGSTVVAAAPGVVAAAAPAAGGGWDIDILHDDEYVTRYGNVFQVTVAPGDAVSAYSPIGSVVAPSRRDATGNEALPAVSFVAWRGGQVVDAFALFETASASP